MLLTFYLAKRF